MSLLLTIPINCNTHVVSNIDSNNQATTNFMLTELIVFNVDFPGGLTYDNINFRALVWICSELFLALAIWTNLLGPINYKYIFKASAGIILLDFLLTMIWLPIGVSKTYGFQDVSFLTSTYNGTGAGDAWNWILSFLSTSGEFFFDFFLDFFSVSRDIY